jgi:hypothetical protein
MTFCFPRQLAWNLARILRQEGRWQSKRAIFLLLYVFLCSLLFFFLSPCRIHLRKPIAERNPIGFDPRQPTALNNPTSVPQPSKEPIHAGTMQLYSREPSSSNKSDKRRESTSWYVHLDRYFTATETASRKCALIGFGVDECPMRPFIQVLLCLTNAINRLHGTWNLFNSWWESSENVTTLLLLGFFFLVSLVALFLIWILFFLS